MKKKIKNIKILAIGDPHGNIKNLRAIQKKDADLIILTGDIGKSVLMRNMLFDNIKRKKMGLPEIKYSPAQEKRAFMEAYNSTIKLIKSLSRFASVFTIFGNVESSNYETKKKSKEIKMKLPFLYNKLNSMKNIRVINNVVANFKGVRIGGLKYFTDTSWVKEFKPHSFKENLSGAKLETDKVRKILTNFGKVDIILCHQPLFGVLDKVNSKSAPKNWKGKHAGSQTILNYIKRYHPRYVFCGHIHEARGFAKIGKTEVYNLGECGYNLINLDN